MTEPISKSTIQIDADTGPALRAIGAVADEISGPLSEVVDSTFGHLRAAIIDFARTGEFSVRDMVNTIIAELSRIAFDHFVKSPLNTLLDGLFGGFGNLFGGGGSSAPVKPGAFGKALGGPVGFGRPYIVGEQGRELFVPETSGRIVPNGALGGGNIIFNVQANDAQSFVRSETQIAAMLNRLVMRGNRNL